MSVKKKVGRPKKKGEQPNSVARSKVPRDGRFGLLLAHRQFVDEYLTNNFNATKAAIAVGYSPHGASVMGSNLLQREDVQYALEVLMSERLKRLQWQGDRVLEQVMLIATSRIDDYVVDDDGTVCLAEGVEDRGQIAAVASAEREFKTRTIGSDGDEETTVKTKIRLWDKPAALRLFMQHAGMLIERTGQVGKDGKLIDPPDQLSISMLRDILQGARTAPTLRQIANAIDTP